MVVFISFILYCLIAPIVAAWVFLLTQWAQKTLPEAEKTKPKLLREESAVLGVLWPVGLIVCMGLLIIVGFFRFCNWVFNKITGENFEEK